MKSKIIVSLILMVNFTLSGIAQSIIIDHNCTDVNSIPSNIIDSIKTNCKFNWAATSHGHQVLTGLKLVESDYPNLDVTIGDGETGWSTGGYLPDPNGTFCVMDGITQLFAACGKCCLGIQTEGYWEGSNAHTSMQKTLTQCYPDINISGWGWCTELGGWSAAQVDEYLNQMINYMSIYPNVQFIFSTGTAEGSGDGGYNRFQRNNQIRNFCIANNQICFDFADLECWSNGEMNYYIHNGDTIPLQHSDYNGNTFHHTNALNCKNKGKAVWYMMALLSGWQNNNTNNPPQIDDQSFNVDENSPNGTIVGTVIASDPDAGQTLTYSIINGNMGDAFQINSTSGEITVDNSIAVDFESNPTFNLTVQVQDNGQGSLTDQATVTVSLNDLNENPIIGNQTFGIDENSPNGTFAGTVIASDPDAGQTLTYSIINGNTSNAFQINASTGELTVGNGSALDFESNPDFNLTVQVQDDGQGNLTDQATITVNLNDVNESPNIDDQTFNIEENSSNGTVIGTIPATDPDNGQSLSFSILDGNVNDAFQIGALSGELTVQDGSVLNFESHPVFTLLVEVEDDGQGNLTDQATITVNLNDVNENPNIDDQTFNIDENSTNGTIVGILVAADPDIGQSLTFSILSGNTEDTFQLDAASGELTVQNNSALNYEMNPVFNLTIEVEDNGQGNLTDQAIITINLNDINEPPVIDPQTLSIDLDVFYTFGDINNNTHLVGEIEALDPDNGQSVSFTILAGNGRGIFELNENTGELFVISPNQLNLIEDYSYPLLVEVKDNSTQQLSATAVVTTYIQLINLTEYFDDIYGTSDVTDIADLKNETLKIYPNPSSNDITIEADNLNERFVNLSIHSFNGEIVKTRNVFVSGGMLTEDIDIRGFSKGIYIVKIYGENSVLYDKFIKK